jgi:hypothetical protein
MSAISVRGVPHPSGYPLFTILGIIFLNLPFANKSPAWKVGLISAMFASLGTVLIYFIVKHLTEGKRVLSIATSLSASFLYPYWLYAETVEIFSMYYFFVLSISFLTLKYIASKNRKFIYLLSFIYGLSLTNNLSTLLTVPGAVVVILLVNPKILKDIKLMVFSLFSFLIGLIPYIYIPIAAAKDPPINWGYAVTLRNFIDLVLRKKYTWGGLSNLNTVSVGINLITYLRYWLINVNIFLLILIFFALIALISRKKILTFTFFILSFLLLGPFYVMYSKYDLSNFGVLGIQERFYTPSIILLLILSPLGLTWLIENLQKYTKNRLVKDFVFYAFVLSFLIMPLLFFITNLRKLNFSNIYIGDNFAKDILYPLPQDSIVWASDDSIGFNSLYLKYSLKERTDILLPGHYGDKYQVLMESNTINMENSRQYLISIENWLDQNVKFSSLGPLVSKGNVYADHKLEVYDDKYGKVIAVPYGLLFKLEFEESYKKSEKEYLKTVDAILASYHLSEFEKNRDLVQNSLIYYHIKRCYALADINISKFINDHYQDKKNSQIYLEKAYIIDPLLKDTLK